VDRWLASLALLIVGTAACADDSPPAVDAPAASSGGTSHQELAKKLQNPFSDLIVLPLQNITTFGFDPGDGIQTTLNIQPVIPVRLNPQWKLLLRPIVPVTYTSWPGYEFGLGDFQFEPFLAPVRQSSAEWGFGLVLSFPTASNDALGFGKYTAGPAFAMFGHNGPWTYSVIATQQWSYAGDRDRDEVSLFNLQPSINYNTRGGWFFIFGPLISADWTAPSGQQWIIPVGGGVGKVIAVGNQKLSVSLEGYWNAEHPDQGPDAMAILTVTMVFRE